MNIQEKFFALLSDTVQENDIKINTPINELTLSHKITELGLDSITFIKLIANIEDEFDIEFDVDQLESKRFETIDDIIDIIKQLCDNQ